MSRDVNSHSCSNANATALRNLNANAMRILTPFKPPFNQILMKSFKFQLILVQLIILVKKHQKFTTMGVIKTLIESSDRVDPPKKIKFLWNAKNTKMRTRFSRCECDDFSKSPCDCDSNAKLSHRIRIFSQNAKIAMRIYIPGQNHGSRFFLIFRFRVR